MKLTLEQDIVRLFKKHGVNVESIVFSVEEREPTWTIIAEKEGEEE